MLAMIRYHWAGREALKKHPALLPDTELRNDRRWDMLQSIGECIGILVLMWGMVAFGFMQTFCAHYPLESFALHFLLIVFAWTRAYGSAREGRRLMRRVKALS